MTLEEKREVLKAIFSITDIAPKSTKDKIEGILIGVSLRDHINEIDQFQIDMNQEDIKMKVKKLKIDKLVLEKDKEKQWIVAKLRK